ncbi:AfsR/SARP family transcriptional regulator [Actinophytocola sp.]|uniref:AfsR/SARP family transcriptional regulator n=1 Tax=Actinophytocola sp. TaxID=1872138 RepID=UPI002ED16C75
MSVQFRLLGPVEADVDGRQIELGHPRQRCVLAVLLVEADRVVPVDAMLDRVWADRLPNKARVTLSGYVSRLRHLLAEAGDVSLARQADGYRLAVDPQAVDLHRFRALVTQARAATVRDEAAALFTEALGLWQGPAFATLDTPWADDVRDELAAERLAAELDRNDLALEQGQHTALLTELTTTAAAHPLDERLAAQLMLALYRCGRQAEALHHYERLRSLLVHEFGADPGAALQQLHQRILTADPTLAPAASTTAPCQLPAPPGSFTGRSGELAYLDTLLRAESTTAVIAGTAGVGKTALAVSWAHRAAAAFPDGQLYVNLRGFGPEDAAMSPAEAVRGFLETLGVPPARVPVSPDAQIGLYRSMLAGRRMLIVLDNARDADQVRPLVPGSGGCLVVVTSRDQLTGLVAEHDARLVTLDLFTAAEARTLLVRRLGADRVEAEPDAVDRIVARCTRLPLALSVVAARAAAHPGFPLAALADELVQAANRLDPLANGDRVTDVRTVFTWSYRTLQADSALLFRLLGLHPGPDTGVAAAASLVGLPAGRTRQLLAELTRAHLLTEHTPGRYAVHDLLREYAAELARQVDTEGERRAALHRVLDHYVHTAHACAMLLHPHRDAILLTPPRPEVVLESLDDSAQALSWFTTERLTLLAAANLATTVGLDTHVWQLAWAAWTFLDRRGHRHDLLAIGRTGLAAADRLADPVGQAPIHRLLVNAYLNLKRYDEAHPHLVDALDLYREIGDLAGQAHTHNNFAGFHERQQRHADALDHSLRAVELYRAAGHRRGQAHGLNSIGWYRTLLGDHEQALVDCAQALPTLQELEDRAGEACTWDSLGHAHRQLGHHAQALTCFQRALVLLREIGDRYLEARILDRTGDTLHAAGDHDAAHDSWAQAVTIFDEVDRAESGPIRAKIARTAR